MDNQDSKFSAPQMDYINITNIFDPKMKDTSSQTSPDTWWHIFGLDHTGRSSFPMDESFVTRKEIAWIVHDYIPDMYFMIYKIKCKSIRPDFTCLLALDRSVK